MPGMSLSMGMEVKQEIKMTQSLKVQQLISMTILTPDGVCPKCDHKMTEDEIKAGWNEDRFDFTTCCPKCGERFFANLLLTEKGQEVGFCVYLCPDQLFQGLYDAQRGKSKRLGKVYLLENKPDLLWNMVRHFGNYEIGLKAFRKQQKN